MTKLLVKYLELLYPENYNWILKTSYPTREHYNQAYDDYVAFLHIVADGFELISSAELAEALNKICDRFEGKD